MLEADSRITYSGLDKKYIADQLMVKASSSLDVNFRNNRMSEEMVLSYEGDDFVKACYLFFLGREADDSGLVAYGNILSNGMSKEGVMYLFARSQEFANRFELKNIERYRQQYMLYEWDVSGVLNHEGRDFIKQCYLDILERLPDESGMYTYSKLLSAGMPKEAIVHLLISSEEASRIKGYKNKEYYLRIYEQYIQREEGIGIKKIFRKIIEKINFRRRLYCEIVASNNLVMSKLEAIEYRLDEIEQNNTEKIAKIFGDVENNTGLIEEAILQNKELENKVNQIGTLHSDSRKEVEALRFELRGVDGKLDKYYRNCKTTVQGYKDGVTCVQVGEFLMGIPSEEWRLAMYLSRYGAFEVGTEKLFCSTVQKDMIVLDVGANLGIFTLHALAAGCKVYAFEPTPRTFRLLKDNVQVNGFMESGRAILTQSAVGETAGMCQFTTYSDVCGHNSIFGQSEDGAETIDVSVVSLDETFGSGTRVDIIKIDVEGAELLVFKGMKRIIKENPHIKIFMEFAPEHLLRAGVQPKEMLEYISNLGLTYYAINELTGEVEICRQEELLKMVSVNLLIKFDEE